MYGRRKLAVRILLECFLITIVDKFSLCSSQKCIKSCFIRKQFDFGSFRGTDWFADVYDQTVVMSPYLVAFVVSDFINKTHTTPNGTKVLLFEVY